ncbi:aminotransferase class V-fold PLP-dependent enzyme [Edaphosphingomonas haloaromaticamans]|uniref:Kynureninase n=1 Tax=Edaphosphingomonas haloaromaticamans TaxID=653954 RepID=A0A1S1HKU1_9SPHN|nr:aminotransferase class V-fold PLP-dependent enzyme [Sphingomonas haloaromaticamans]OHT22026.1 Kynureninase [Sphingomonas haloaromaticamans]
MTPWRALFDVPEGGPYLLAHSAGALPHAARSRIETAVLQPWAKQGAGAWDDWLGAIDEFRMGLAGLLGGVPAEYCPQANVSGALFRLLSAMPREPGRDILLASEQSFPSIGYAMAALAPLGYRLELLTGDPADAASWAAAIHPGVAAVVPMHVHSNSGAVAPVAEIAALARGTGAASIVDVAQSAGVVPIDMPSWGVDAAVGSCLKWLCGGPGAGWLWADAAFTARAQPLEVGWFSHADPFTFDIRDFRYATDARRFWGGTPSIAPFALAAGGIATVAGIGVPQIFAHNRRLTARVANRAGDRWFPADRRGFGGTLCIRADGAAEAALAAAGCRFDRRGAVLRLSFHAYNDDAEADLVGEVLAGL